MKKRAAADLMRRQWMVFLLMSDGHPRSIADIASALGTTKAQTDAAVKTIRDAGFKVRQLKDVEHRQRMLYYVEATRRDGTITLAVADTP